MIDEDLWARTDVQFYSLSQAFDLFSDLVHDNQIQWKEHEDQDHIIDQQTKGWESEKC